MISQPPFRLDFQRIFYIRRFTAASAFELHKVTIFHRGIKASCGSVISATGSAKIIAQGNKEEAARRMQSRGSATMNRMCKREKTLLS